MTRKQLKDLGLEPETIEQVIGLHVETVDALRKEMETMRQQSGEHHNRVMNQACVRLLRSSGAHEQAIPLLMKELDTGSAVLNDEGEISNVDDLLAPLKERYDSLFARARLVGLPDMNPPTGGTSMLTREDVRTMDADDINRNWGAVRYALQN